MSDSSHFPSLSARIDKLEADAARLKRLFAIACAALVGTTAIGAAAVSRATAPFTIVDSAGRTRVRIDTVGLHVLDANGKERITVGFNAKNQPIVHLNDKNGTLRESMYLSPTQVPGLQQYDAAGNTRSTYDLSGTKSAGSISFDGAEGGRRYYVTGTDLPFERFGDEALADRMDVGLTTAGDGLVRMFDKNGKETISVEGQAATPFIRMSQNANERVYLGLATDGSEVLDLEQTATQEQVELTGSANPFFRLTDSSAQKRAYVGVYSDGTTGVSIWDSTGALHWSSP